MPEPTETVASPTATMTPTPELTNTPPDLYPGYPDFHSDSLGLSFQYPPDLSVKETEAFVIVAPEPDALLAGNVEEVPIIIFASDTAPTAGLPVSMHMTRYRRQFGTDLELRHELEEFEVAGQQASFGVYEGEIAGFEGSMSLLLGIVVKGKNIVLIYSIIPTESVAEIEPVFRNVMSTIQVEERTVADLLAPYFAVAEYDPARDPEEDLAAAMAEAEATGKRILLVVGGVCLPCDILDDFLLQHRPLAEELAQEFVIVKVTVDFLDEAVNADFLSHYPEIEEYPHFFILNADGTLAASIDFRQLQTNNFFDVGKFEIFWAE